MTHATALEVREALLTLANSGAWRVYDGPHLESLRHLLQCQFQRQHVRLCSSGTFGMELAIRSLKLPPESEVLLAGYDYPGNFRSIEDAGLKVALVDVGKHGWTLNPETLERAVGPQSRAVVVSHLHGQLADMQAITDWAERNSICVIEDACQEPGATLGSIESLKPVGSFGHLSVLSFGGSKPLSAGRGGVVMTNDPQLAQRMTIFCERGNDAYALSELQAAVLIPQVKHLATDSMTRHQAAARLLAQTQTLPWLHCPIAYSKTGSDDGQHPGYYKLGFQLQHPTSSESQVDDITTFRDRLLMHMTQAGIKIGPGFRGFIGRSQNRCRHPVELSNSNCAAKSTVVLDHSHLLCPDSGTSSIAKVVDALATFNKTMNQ